MQAAPIPRADKDRPPLDFALLPIIQPDEIHGVFAARLGDIFAAPEMAETAEKVNELIALFRSEAAKAIGIPFFIPFKIQDVEQISGHIRLKLKDDPVDGGSFMLGLRALRMKQPVDWVELMKADNPGVEVIEREGRTYFRLECGLPMQAKSRPMYFAVVDARTILLEGFETIEGCIDSFAKSEPDWAEEWKTMQKGLVAAVIQHPRQTFAKKFRDYKPREDANSEEKVRTERMVKILCTASRLAVGIDTSAGLRMKAGFTCDELDDAAELEKACESLISSGRMLAKALPRPKENDTADEKAAFEFQKSLLDNLAVDRQGTVVSLSVNSKGAGLKALQDLLVSARLKAAPSRAAMPPGGLQPQAPMLVPVGAVMPNNDSLDRRGLYPKWMQDHRNEPLIPQPPSILPRGPGPGFP